LHATLEVEVVIYFLDCGIVREAIEEFNVPRRVSTESGVVMAGGIGVVILIFGGVCAYPMPGTSTTVRIRTNACTVICMNLKRSFMVWLSPVS
jgi:hypothetical protein